MPKHSAHWDYDPVTGRETIFHRYHDGSWAVQEREDISPVLDDNKEQQSHGPRPGAMQPAGMRLAARIPAIIILKWLNDYGIDFYNPDHERAWVRLLNSSEWKWLRTTDETI